MLINLAVYAGPNNNGPNEGRVLMNALRAYTDQIRRRGFAENEGDATPTLHELLNLTCSIAEEFLVVSEQLDPCSEPDGRGDYQTVYRPITTKEIATPDFSRITTHAHTDFLGVTTPASADFSGITTPAQEVPITSTQTAR